MISYEECKRLIECNGIDFKNIPKKYLSSEEIFKEAVRKIPDQSVLDNFKITIPKKLQTKEIFKFIIKTDPFYFSDIPKKNLTENDIKELLEFCIKHDPDTACLNYIPLRFKTQEICNLSIKHHGYNIAYTPKKFITYDLCKIAVTNYSYSLERIPKKFLTQEICEIAVKNIKNSYESRIILVIPYKLQTENMCKIIVEFNGNNLKYISPHLRTDEICEIASKTQPDAGQWALKGTVAYNNYIMQKALL